MKAIITLFLLILAGSVFAQQISYLENNPEWRISYGQRISDNCVELWEYVEYLDGDTTINGRNYFRVFERGKITEGDIGPDPNNLCGSNFLFNHSRGFIRQEGSKFYYLESPQAPEYLMYDFDLDTGDTLPITCIMYSEHPIVVASVDSIFIQNSFRKVYTLQGEGVWVTNKLIEGIGFGSGLLSNFPEPEFFHTMLCYASDSKTWYPDSTSYCELNVSNLRSYEQVTFEVFPNPATDNIFLKLPETLKFPASLLIYSNTGQLLKEQIIIGSELISIQDIPTGIYLLRLTDSRNVPYKTKFIKQ